MLEVIECEKTKKENIEFNIYIPINIEFGEWNISEESTIYWRKGDFSKSLIEIEIGEYKKDIRSITLTICKNIYEIDNYLENNCNIFEGSPIFELDNIDDEIYTDRKAILNVYIESRSVSIIFSDNEIINCIQNNNVYFYLDASRTLVGLRINNVSGKNKAILKKALV